MASCFDDATKRHVPDVMERGGVLYRLVTDHLGSVRYVVDTSTGEIAQALEYDVFGKVESDSAPGFQPFGYAGGLYDAATGLVRFGARDYDPEVGRWTAKDPIRFAGGDGNLYAYVGGDVVNRVDPSGLAPPHDIPPGVDVAQDIIEAQNMSYSQWYKAVRNGGKWDYKQRGSQYEAFGNYNFGVTARAIGIPGNIPNRGAGWAQRQAGTGLPEWGKWWDWTCSSTSFGDDPADQCWINEGIKDYENGYYDPKVYKWNAPPK